MKESSIVRAIMHAVTAQWQKAWVRKLSDRYTRGLPDIIIVMPGGAVVFVEVKRDDGRLAKLQEHNAFSVNRLGGRWIIATSASEVISYLKDCKL